MEQHTILLVEDDATIREMTQLSLERDGFVVDTAADGPAGLEAFRAGSPDLVLLDVMLPGLDGVSVCRAIRESSVVPVVMLTARTDAVDVVLGLEAGDRAPDPDGSARAQHHDPGRVRAGLGEGAPQREISLL